MYFSPRLFGMTEGFRLRIFLAALVGLLAVAAGIGRLAISGVVIARVFQGAAFSTLTVPLVAVAALIVLRGYFQYLRDIISDHTASEIKIRLRTRLYRHALALGPGYFDQRRTGDVLMFLVDGVENLEAFFGQYLPQFFVAAIAPVLIFGFMAALDLQIGIIFLGFAIFTFLVPSVVHRMTRHLSLARRDSYGALGADFLDSVQGLATLKAFGQSRQRGEQLARRARHLYRSTMRVFVVDGSSSAATILGISAGAAVALAWGAMRVTSGDLELLTLLIVLMLGAEVFRPLRELTQLYHQGMVAMASAEGVFALLDSPVTIQGPITPRPATQAASDSGDTPSQPGGLTPEIRFEGVTMGYEGGRRRALEDVSFELHAGETLGLVGASGAGKTTIVSLILRFLDPQQGRILLGGRDLKELPLDQIREQIAVVNQDTYLFHGTVAENLRLGRADATREEMEAAARTANAHKFIAALPQGYDTTIGERGVKLSGGEAQRIAIARALLKSAPILVLDEALSSVDAQNEAAIQQALERLMADKTTLVIAHRLSSVVGADRILVLDEGELVESGSHGELVTANGAYARLMANQQTSPEQDLIVATLPPTNEGGTIHEKDYHSTAEGLGGLNQPPVVSQRAASPTTWTVWTRLLGLVRPRRAELGLSLVSGLVYNGAIVGLGAISALLVGEIFKGGETGLLLILLALFVSIASLARWGEAWASHDLAYRLLATMRIDIYNKLEPLAPAYMVRRRSGDLASIVGGDIEAVENFYAHVITPAMVAVLIPSGVLLALAFVAWPLALVLAPFLIAAAASPFFAQKRSERPANEMRRRLGDMNAHMVDSIQGMRETVAFGQGHLMTRDIVEKGRNFARHRMRFLKAQAFQASYIESITALGGIAVLTVGIWLVVEGHMVRAVLPLATLLALTSFAPVAEVARTLRQFMETLAASHRIFQIHDEPVAVKDGAGVSEPHTGGPTRAPSISFEDVMFFYGPGQRPALQNVTIAAEAGQTLALVGRSGAGKTTCAHLLLRFWDPGSGRVMLQGHDLRQYKLDTLRSQIALVSQDTYLFNSSLRDNLRMAKQDATDSEIEEAARLANAHEFIEAMPDGYDTLAGERGRQLSGGQRQRISIARALLKDTPVLILDEATSHLDAVNERQVREALHRLMEGRTTLVIAHRLSTVRDADRIVVLDSGRVVEEGSHQHLLAAGGLYAQLVSTQIIAASSQPQVGSPD